jgi:hypothetical protein
MRHGRARWIGGRRDDSGSEVEDEAAPSEAAPAGPPGGWWGPLAQLVRAEVLVGSGQVNHERDCYQLGEWVRSGSAMAAFTLERDPGRDEDDDETSPETRSRRHLMLHVVVAFGVEVADHAFTADGVDWLYPQGHSCCTSVVAGAVDGGQMAGFLERVAQQVGGAARVGRIDGLMAAFSRADALYLARSTRG